MQRRALVAALQRNETTAMSTIMTFSPTLARRFGMRVARFGNTICLVAARFPKSTIFNRAIGFGTLATPGPDTLARVLRFYDRMGAVPHVEAYGGVAPEAVRLLERAGLSRQEIRLHVHVRERADVPEAPRVPGLRIERVRVTEARRYAAVTRRGFGARGAFGLFLERATAAMSAARSPRRVFLVARLEGVPVGTGALFFAGRVAGLYSGSVLPAYRGRGIQSALIAERLRIGVQRGVRLFTSQTRPDGASQHNLHDMGFRTLYRTAYYTRP